VTERVGEEDPDLAIFSEMLCENGRDIGSFLFSGLGLQTSQKAPTMTCTGMPLRYSLLQFWTVSVFFKAGDIDVNHSTNLTGSDGSMCGHMLFDDFEETTFFDANEQFELLLISGGGSTLLEGEPRTPESDDEQFKWLLFSAAGPMLPGVNPIEPKSYLGYYTVMVIEWIGLGVAERRGVGRIERDALQRSFAPGPVWKEILLC